MTRPLQTDAAIIEPETPWAQTRLVMLGTIHRDREGADHLSRWLDNLRPEVITLEFSPYGMMFRRTHRETLRAKVDALVAEMERRGEPVSGSALEALYDYIEFPYEYTITSQYAEEVGIPFHLLDPGVFSYVKLQEMDELLDPENISSEKRKALIKACRRKGPLPACFLKTARKPFRIATRCSSGTDTSKTGLFCS
jgi:hypothetical protein